MNKQNEIKIHKVEGYGDLWFMSSSLVKNLSLYPKDYDEAFKEAFRKHRRMIAEGRNYYVRWYK